MPETEPWASHILDKLCYGLLFIWSLNGFFIITLAHWGGRKEALLSLSVANAQVLNAALGTIKPC